MKTASVCGQNTKRSKSISTKIDFRVFNVVKRKGKEDYWNRLGGAFIFQTEDGRSRVSIPSLNLVLLEPKPDDPVTADELSGDEA